MRRLACLLLAASCAHPEPWDTEPAPIPIPPEPPITVVRTVPDFVYHDAGNEKVYEVWLFNDGVVDGTFVTVQEPGRPPRTATMQEWNFVMSLRREVWASQDLGGKIGYLYVTYNRERTEDINYWNARIDLKEEAVRVLEERQWDTLARLRALEATHQEEELRAYLAQEAARVSAELHRERARLTLLRLKRQALFSPEGVAP